MNGIGTTSEFYCTQCGNRGIPIIRKKGHQREEGHLKRIYCLYCKQVTNHAEIRPFGNYTLENFKEEFELGRFVNGKKVPIINLINCDRTNCKYNKHGKCWNSNNSYHCNHKIVMTFVQRAEAQGLEKDR